MTSQFRPEALPTQPSPDLSGSPESLQGIPDAAAPQTLYHRLYLVPEYVEPLQSPYAAPADHERVYGFSVPNTPEFTDPVIETIKPYAEATRVIIRRRRETHNKRARF